MNIEELNKYCEKSFVEHIGIRFTHCDEESLSAEIRLTALHLQPAGVVHGGVYISLAETLAGAGSSMMLETDDKIALGNTINSQHLASAKAGVITATAVLIHKSSFKHIWDVKISDELGKLISISRVTNSIKDLN